MTRSPPPLRTRRRRRRPTARTTSRLTSGTFWRATARSLRAGVRRTWRALRAAPRWTQIAVAVVIVVLVWALANWVFQVIRKPAELFFPVSGALFKTPAETWQRYQSIFRDHATATITPDFLAALAQIEGSGNPVARTYWRWYATWDLFEIYRPASSAVGMYQITDATFDAARRYCIHDHAVVEDGPWHAWRSCWFNSLYTRVVPSHAAELTSAYLDRAVARMLERQRVMAATVQQKQDLAALIHLCGAGAGEAFARRGFRLTPGQRCGDHDAAVYLARINTMKRLFARMASK